MMQITILEFAPCADWICHFHRDQEEGYLTGDAESLTIQSGAKLRPQVASIYAGGKATNVARVIDRLLNDDEQVEIELVVFRPDSPEGRYIHELQTSALSRVRVRPVIINAQARLCVDLFDPETSREERVAFNLSPRVRWGAGAVEAALDLAAGITGDLLLIAGNPPVLETNGDMLTDLYAEIIERVRPRVKTISLDTEKKTLASCLQTRAKPDVIKINAEEHRWVDEVLWRDYDGTLVVTDAKGCWVQERRQTVKKISGATVNTLYSTIGAGDAMHAGFTLARWVRGFDSVRASRYGQAVAAATVSSNEGTRNLDKQVVGKIFAELESENEEEGV
jgi:fructose-1-phosphate kinase PfkB-like protein